MQKIIVALVAAIVAAVPMQQNAEQSTPALQSVRYASLPHGQIISQLVFGRAPGFGDACAFVSGSITIGTRLYQQIEVVVPFKCTGSAIADGLPSSPTPHPDGVLFDLFSIQYRGNGHPNRGEDTEGSMKITFRAFEAKIKSFVLYVPLQFLDGHHEKQDTSFPVTVNIIA
jgi:hypothetical protein